LPRGLQVRRSAKLNIGASGREFTPPKVEIGGRPTYRSGLLAVG